MTVSPRRRSSAWWLGAVGLVIVALAVMLAGSARDALAGGTPDISLSVQSPNRVLYGETAEVTLSASNPIGSPPGYNLSFRAVLPAGISYQGGAIAPPQVIANQPALGQTTLIWENLADLTPNSSYGLSFDVGHSTTDYEVADTYAIDAGAYINGDPRFVPDFDGAGQPIGPQSNSFTGFDTGSATTEITAITLDKSEPNAEGEILRGVHDHRTVYTLTARNNLINPTSGILIEDYLPAGLEFLGCAVSDNTTNAPTNPGNAEEYPGSGPLNGPGEPAAPDCLTPTSVETVSLDPDGAGPLASGVYTHVIWSGLGTLAPGATRVIQYRAGIPIRENTMDWNGAAGGLGTAPGTGGAQGSNLDNNSGAETADEQQLTNYALARGSYNGSLPVQDDDYLDRTAEDLSVHKSVSNGVIEQGDIETWSLLIEASEYRYVDDVRVTDTLPDGLCPIGATNLEGSAECAPSGDLPSAPYESATENANGSWTLAWDQSTEPALARLQPSSSVLITFPTRTREFYQENGNDAAPVLSRDSWSNSVAIAGSDFVRCAPSDPDCSGAGSKIDADEIDGVDDLDASSAGQSAGGPSIDKRVGAVATPMNCASATYLNTPGGPFGPGDRVCWLLRVDFPANLDTGQVNVTDFIPPGMTYETGSAALTANNTVAASLDDSQAASGVLAWSLGNVDAGGQVFEARFSSIITDPDQAASFDIGSNLMKMSHLNSPATSFPLRDMADYTWTEADLSLLKGVRDVNDLPGGGNPADTDHVEVQGGDLVTYRVDVDNNGSRDASGIEVWDVLPAEVDCSMISAISNGGVCNPAENRIEWSGLNLAGKALEADPAPRLTLTYDLTVPAGVEPGQQLDNAAGVRTYESATNLPGTFTYIPADNIDPDVATTLGDPNAAAADDVSDVYTPNVTLTKARTTEITQAGNAGPDQATIGEEINYTLTYTVPEGTTLYGGASISDPLGARQTYIAGSAAATLNGGALPGGVALSDAANTITLDFPATYANAAGSGDDVFQITFRAQVDDDFPANQRTGTGPSTLANAATATWETQTGSPQSANASVNTTIVEPNLAIAKNENDADDIVSPGQIIRYTLTVTNPSSARVSTANDLVITDQIPANLTPVDGGGNPIADLGAVPPDGGIWNQGTRTITWALSSLAPGGSAQLRYDVRVNDPIVAAGALTNLANVVGTSLPDPQDDQGERTSASAGPPPGYAANTSDTVTLVGATISKSASTEQATIGDDIVYTLQVTIPSGVELPDATVIDTLPDGIDFDGPLSAICSAGCPPNVSPVALPAQSQANGSTILGWFLGDVSAAATPRTITITYAAHVDDLYEPEATPVIAGGAVTNTSRVHWNLADEISGTPAATPAAGDFDRSSPLASDVILFTEPSLAIDKDVSGDVNDDDLRETQPGDSFTYSLEVRNNGTAPAYDVVVRDAPDAELTNVVPTAGASFITDGWSAGDPDIVWTVPGPIAPGASLTLTYTADLIASSGLSDGQSVDNTATVPSYFGVPEGERTTNGFDYREYTSTPPDAVQLTVDLPALTIAKTTGVAGFPESADAEVGQAFTWRVVVSNSASAATAHDVDITDVLPANWDYVAGSATFAPGGPSEPAITSSASGDQLLWADVADIAPGGTLTLTFSARPTPDAATTPGSGPLSPHVNIARATADDASGASGSQAGPYATADDPAQAILRLPALTVAKTPDGDTAVAGAASQFQILVSNTGDGTARGITVTDLLPSGINYTPGTATAPGLAETSVVAGPGLGQTTITWTLPPIAAGGSATILVPVQVRAPAVNGTVLVNSASVQADELIDPVSNLGSLTVGSAPVWLGSSVKTASPASGAVVAPSDRIDYNVHYENTGNEDATGVVITDAIPAGSRFIAGSAASTPAVGVEYLVGGVYQPTEPGDPTAVQGLRFAVGAVGISSGGDVSFAVSVNNPLPDGTVISNQASLTSDQTPVGVVIGPVSHTVNSATGLTLAKSVSDSRLVMNEEGDRLTYSLTLTNSGNENANNVVISDAPPAGTTLAEISAGGAAVSCSTDPAPPLTFGACPSDLSDVSRVRWSYPQVTTSTPVTVAMTVVVPRPFADETVLSNTADYSSTESGPGTSNTVMASIDTAARLVLDKAVGPAGTISPGATLTYTLGLSNTGSDDARNPVISDAVPANTTYVAGSADAGAQFLVGGSYQASEPADPSLVQGVRWSPADLGVGASISRQFQVRAAPVLDPGTEIANTAAAEADTIAPVNDSVQTPVSSKATLALTKVASTERVRIGDTITYTITARTGGDANSKGVVITDTLPKGLSAVSVSEGGFVSGNTITWNLGTLSPGSERSVSLVARVLPAAADGRNLQNQATVNSTTPGTTAEDAEASIPAPPRNPALLRIQKRGPLAAKAGSRVTWRIVVRNTGKSASEPATVVDRLPRGFSMVGSSRRYTFKSGSVRWSIGKVPAGRSKVISVTLRADRDIRGRRTNVAIVSAGNATQVAGASSTTIRPVARRTLPAVTG